MATVGFAELTGFWSVALKQLKAPSVLVLPLSIAPVCKMNMDDI